MNIYEQIRQKAKIGIGIVKEGKIFSRREAKSPFAELVDNPHLTEEQNAKAREQRRLETLEEVGLDLLMSPETFEKTFLFPYSKLSLKRLEAKLKEKSKLSGSDYE